MSVGTLTLEDLHRGTGLYFTESNPGSRIFIGVLEDLEVMIFFGERRYFLPKEGFKDEPTVRVLRAREERQTTPYLEMRSECTYQPDLRGVVAAKIIHAWMMETLL
jgi:hypothetical protein